MSGISLGISRVLFSFLFAAALIFPSSPQANQESNNEQSTEVRFSSGDAYTAYNLQGSLTLFCPSRTRYTNCYGYTLSPTMWDHLVFPASVQADEVKLTNLSSRSQRSKTSRIRSGENRSRKAFNLWVRTLLQRPLLAPGSNTIAYEFSRNNSITEQGEFQVYVNDGGNKMCPPLRMAASDRDCDNPSLACDSYFRAVNCL